MKDPWYQDGLQFECTRCGNCCTGEPGYVWVSKDEIAAIAEHLSEAPEQTRDFYTRKVGSRRSLRERPDGDCVLYDKNEGCTVYAARPRQCRTWPFWESNVATPQAWEQTCKDCPGAGKGTLISAEEITRRLEVIKL